MEKIAEYDKEIDSVLTYETERKFFPENTRELASLKNHITATAIEQIYLSSPDEQFSIRLREYVNDHDVLDYEATLKDRGEMLPEGLKRIAISTPVSADLYNFYKSAKTPVIRKIRAQPIPNIVVDFYEDGTVQVESEDQEQWHEFTKQFGSDFVEVTGTQQSDNEHRAHYAYESQFGGKLPREQLEVTAGQIMKDVLERGENQEYPTLVHIGGRSGSGKSTIVKDLLSGLNAFGVSGSVLSTDDYHRGATWLQDYNNGEPWCHWDDKIVYDLASMQQDLLKLKSSSPVAKREIDWTTVESYSISFLEPADVIIIEGIYATDPLITGENDLTYILNTPLATCIGRRLLRDIKERPQFSDPAKSLFYMLTDAEPAFREQHGIAS